ncbi:MAG: GRAM domain-containing protein, partial [Benniella sp.]
MNGGNAFGYDTQEYADPACAAGPGHFREDSNEQHYDLNNTGSRQGSEDGFSESPTAFVYANEKRFNDFHTLFRSVPEDEKLIEDYGCALQKEILVQGRLYISENHICFNANIFGWVTNLVIAFSEITAIEKRLTAFVIPNAISISTATNTKGHFFASFLSRDAAYDLLMAAWRKSFPCAANASALSNNASGRSRAESESPSDNRANDHRHTNGEAKSSTKANGGGNSNRAPTVCKCSKDGRHYANTYLQETYPGSVESLWKLLFESEFNKGFLTNEVMKGADVQEEAWQKAPDGTLTKTTRYTKWLGMPIGPKTTKAILTDVCENKDFDQYVTTVTTTSTPDVPSGGCFTTKCRTCITWAGPNKIQVLVTGAVEFTKSSWIKGQIEKGAADGMTAHYKELNQCIRKYI